MTTARTILARLRGDDGAAAVSFILTFPIFLLIVAIIVQLALIVTAKIMVSHAADTAARAAMTSLAEDKPENVRRAAWIALAPVSPVSEVSPTSEAVSVAEALRQLGTPVADSFAGRYTYAAEATQVRWTPDRDFISAEGSTVEVEVSYQFRLTVPFAMRLVRGTDTTVAGLGGRFWEVRATRQVQLAHGRKAQLSPDYWSR